MTHWDDLAPDLREQVLATLLCDLRRHMKTAEAAGEHRLPARVERFDAVLDAYRAAIEALGYSVDYADRVTDRRWSSVSGRPIRCKGCKTLNRWKPYETVVVCDECGGPHPLLERAIVTVGGLCALCGEPARANEFCYGCRHYICGGCDRISADDPGGSHTRGAHVHPRTEEKVWVATVRVALDPAAKGVMDPQSARDWFSAWLNSGGADILSWGYIGRPRLAPDPNEGEG